MEKINKEAPHNAITMYCLLEPARKQYSRVQYTKFQSITWSFKEVSGLSEEKQESDGRVKEEFVELEKIQV